MKILKFSGILERNSKFLSTGSVFKQRQTMKLPGIAANLFETLTIFKNIPYSV